VIISKVLDFWERHYVTVAKKPPFAFFTEVNWLRPVNLKMKGN
jgi:hypothetical protein